MRRVLVLGAVVGAGRGRRDRNRDRRGDPDGAQRDRHGDLQELGVDGSLRAKLEDAAECVGLGGS
jgi:hypothetical protein